MPYNELRLSGATPMSVRNFIRDTVELTFRDVHSMLRLPQSSDGLEAGCNYSIAQNLLNVISGVSTIFYDSSRPNRDRFVGCLKDFYPWRMEHDYHLYPQCVQKTPACNILYDLFRTPFAHTLGLDMKMEGGGRKSVRVIRRMRSKPFRIGVVRIVQASSGFGLTPKALLDLELRPHRPDWIPCTVVREEDGYLLSCEGLYFGVRRMIEKMAEDTACTQHAAAFLL